MMANLNPKTKTVIQATSLVVVMGGLAWASVPFYDWFCRVTGYGGTTNTAEAGSDIVLDFVKIDCFCFEEQILQPGERVQMPVTFFVDPELVDDPDAKFAKAVTLSYTFYEIDLPEEQAALATDGDGTQLR